MERYLCIHGHFYQPPRENPWLEAIEIQDSAHPYHDWNERITAECYAPNASSRILDRESRIVSIVSNYAKISFNMGPTLLSWMQRHAPEVYAAVLEADRLSMKLRSGHGAAMAQAYNHVIMPLASSQDKRTQIVWGIRDFRHRFDREPEGMWLPETAVDLESLDIMASLGIRFTILAPHQASRIRPRGAGEGAWVDVGGGRIDPSRAYDLRLPSGRGIALFFYDSPVSHAVAFERLLDSGEKFAHRLLGGFSEVRSWPQLMHICTDGESYGHHHRFGDMALAYALKYIEDGNLARLTNYGEYLAMHPPEFEVRIFENTSWSCSHGVERWRSDCGCRSGIHAGWRQGWRAPLREALDTLRDKLSKGYAKNAAGVFMDPWAARDDYISVILDRSTESVEAFLLRHCERKLRAAEMSEALGLLEMQRHLMLMYTSCGWFFDDISGIETVQIIQYAGRAIQLADMHLGIDAEKTFVSTLKRARSNVPQLENGAMIYMKFVSPLTVHLRKVAAHYAISSLFMDYDEEMGIYAYRVRSADVRHLEGARPSFLTGRCVVTSNITLESEAITYAVLHLGDHDINCGVRRTMSEHAYQRTMDELWAAFHRGAFADVIRLMDKNFPKDRFTLKDLFRDEQRKILNTLIAETTDSVESAYRAIFEDNRFLMGFLREAYMPIPKAFTTAAELTLNLDMRRLIENHADVGEVRRHLGEFERWGVRLNSVDLEFASRRHLETEVARLGETPGELELLRAIEKHLDIALTLPFNENLWSMQNVYYRLAKSVYPEYRQRMNTDRRAEDWVSVFQSLGRKLHFNLDAVLGK